MYSFMIPIAYSIALSFSWSAGVSGLLIGFDGFGLLLGALITGRLLVPRLQRNSTRRKVIVALPLLQAMSYAILAWALYIEPKASTFIGVLLFVVRFCEGIGTGMNSISDNVAREVATSAEQISLSMWMVSTIMVGVAVGPWVSSVGLLLAGADGDSVSLYQIAAPAALVAAIEMMVAVMFSMSVPTTLDELKERGEPAVVEEDTDTSVTPMWNGMCSPRSVVIFCGAAFCIDAMAALMLESATSFILQDQYDWQVWLIGLFIGCAFNVSAAIVFGAGFVNERDLISPTKLSVLCLVFVCGGSVLLFNFGESYQILIGDVLVYPTEGTVMSLALGLMYTVADSNSWYNIENMNLLVTAWDGVTRVVSPTLSRTIIEQYGRNAYAGTQLVLSFTAGIFLFSQVHRMMGTEPSATKGKDVNDS